jgi:putative ABC transport system permease protein
VLSFLSDLRSGLRYAARKRAVAVLTIAMLAIGIGATTAMFTVLDGVLWRELPYRNPSRLVTIWQTFPHWRGDPALDTMWNRIALSYSEYRRVSALRDDFDDVAGAYWRQDVRWTGRGNPIEVSVARGSASLLPMLGLEPAVGRWFLPGEEGPSAPQIAVLSHQLWVDRFGGDPQALGATIDLEGRPFVVVGVLPAAFPFVSLSPFARPADRASIWTPVGSWSGDLIEGSQNYEVIARLRPGVSLERARLDAARVIRGDRSPTQHDAVVIARQSAEVGDVSSPLLALLAAAMALLAITCGNLAALLLGEGVAREPEIRTRLALGASPARIVRQLVAESTMLAMAGGLVGVAVAAGLSKALVALAPGELPHANQIGVSARVLVLSVLTACTAAVAFGLAPALSLARLGRGGSATRTISRRRSRLQQVLMAGQISLSGLLLLASGVLARTLVVETRTSPGFATTRLLVIPLNGSSRDSSRDDPGATQRFYDDVIARLRALPGVDDVTATSNAPIAGRGGQWAISIDPAVKLSSTSPSAQHDEILPGFFESLGLRLLAGRSVTEDDRAGTPLVAVVNETMARQFWPTERAIGKRFLAPNGGVRTVVGIVADIRERGMARAPLPTFYETVRQVATSFQFLLVKTHGDPLLMAEPARRVIWSVDAQLPVGEISTMERIVYASLAPERYRAALVAFFALVAALMTAVGIAGVAMRAVASQRRELCIRMAIGATAHRVVRLVVVRYLRVALIGLGGAGALSVVALRLVTAYLVGVTTRDPLTFATVTALVLVMVSLAAWLPARRIHATSLAEELARH